MTSGADDESDRPIHAADGRTAAPARHPPVDWHYDATERVVDGIIHAIGVAVALAGAIAIIVLSANGAFSGDEAGADAGSVSAALVYGATLLAALGASAAYNVWPVSPTKWILRRFDHSAIFLLIAGTYTPFLVRLGTDTALALLAVIWLTCAAGIFLKLVAPGRFDGLSVVLYLALGWSGAMVYPSVAKALPATALVLVIVGGSLYSAGVIFHLWRKLRFQNAIWHAFVLAAASCHYAAVVDLLVTQG